MLFRIGRRVAFSGLAFFAMLGFISVPLGDKSGWEHLKAIAATPAASQAIVELKTSVLAAESRLVAWVTSWATHQVSGGLAPADSAHVSQLEEQVPQRHKDAPRLHE